MFDRSSRATAWMRLSRLLAAIALLASAAGARAAVIVSGSVANTVYGYGFVALPPLDSANQFSVRAAARVGGHPDELGLDFVSSASNGSFYFLQDHYCVGQCVTFAITTITLTLTNTGTGDALVRFDSQITPGHLARQGINPTASAGFDFDVTQTTGGTSHTLYSADGVANASQVDITTSDGKPFNGLFRSDNGAAWNVLDWSATNLNLLLDAIPAGGTSELVYRAQVATLTAASSCSDITACAGVQVAFGDPRNNGGGSSSLQSARSLVAPEPTTVLFPVIGRLFNPRAIPIAFVDPSAPLPPNPPVIPKLPYGAPFQPQATPPVPEPASWALLLAGAGLLGAALRRRAGRQRAGRRPAAGGAGRLPAR